jgi:hypothetical protein
MIRPIHEFVPDTRSYFNSGNWRKFGALSLPFAGRLRLKARRRIGALHCDGDASLQRRAELFLQRRLVPEYRSGAIRRIRSPTCSAVQWISKRERSYQSCAYFSAPRK